MKPTFYQIAEAKKILASAGYIGLYQLFSTEDIIYRCKDLGFERPNPDQIDDIICEVEAYFDSDIGINNDSINKAIFNVLNN